MGGRSPLLPRGPRVPLADLHLPVGRAFTPRTKTWLGGEVDALLSPQPRPNKGVIDDLSSASVQRPRRGTQMQYESSVFSPPGVPVTPRRQGLKQMLGSSNASELREILRSPRMDQGQSADDEMHFKRRKAGKRVLASYDAMKQVVQKLDTSRTGAITARDLNNALDKLGIKMRRDDFRRLAEDVDPGSQGNAATHLPALGRVPEEPARRRGERRRTPGLGGGRLDGQGDQRTKAASSGSWRKMLEMKVARHWKQLQRDFKRLDPQRSGLVDMHNLISALEVYGVTLETEDADALYLQLGVGRTGKMQLLKLICRSVSIFFSRPSASSYMC
jgi:Ca2+-binding EF-hand superfamily protein